MPEPAEPAELYSPSQAWSTSCMAARPQVREFSWTETAKQLMSEQKMFRAASNSPGRALTLGELQTGSSIVVEGESVTRREPVPVGHN